MNRCPFLVIPTRISCTLRWTRLRVRLSRKERRMKLANATNLNRKSGGAKRADLRFRGPLLETRNDKGEVGVPMRVL